MLCFKTPIAIDYLRISVILLIFLVTYDIIWPFSVSFYGKNINRKQLFSEPGCAFPAFRRFCAHHRSRLVRDAEEVSNDRWTAELGTILRRISSDEAVGMGHGGYGSCGILSVSKLDFDSHRKLNFQVLIRKDYDSFWNWIHHENTVHA